MPFARRFSIAALCTFGMLFGTSATQAQQTKLLPNDTEMLVTLNLQQILKSEVLKSDQSKAIVAMAKEKVTEMLDDKGLTKYLKAADFDLLTDLHIITLGIPAGRTDEGVIILEGKFDKVKIEAAATEASKDDANGLKAITIGRIKAFEVTPNKDEKPIYVGVLNKTTMIACSTKADFIEAVARLDGSKSPKFKSDVFKNLLETVDSKQSISFAGTGPMLAKLAEKAPKGAGGDQGQMALGLLKQLDGFSAAVTIQKNIDFQIGVPTKDDEGATQLAGAGTIALALARAQIAEQAKKDERLAPAVEIMKTLRLSAQGSNLVVRGQITFETLGKILQNLPLN